MKNVLIGGLFALIGSIWALAISVAAGSNLVSGWSTPPGRFLTTVSEMGLLPVAASGAGGGAVRAVHFTGGVFSEGEVSASI